MKKNNNNNSNNNNNNSNKIITTSSTSSTSMTEIVCIVGIATILPIIQHTHTEMAHTGMARYTIQIRYIDKAIIVIGHLWLH